MTVTNTEHFGIARKIVSNMTSESWETIPHACVTYDADVTKFFDVLKEINSSVENGKKITVNTAILRVIVEGLRFCPKMNGHIKFNRKLVRGTVETIKNIDISMPVILKNGEMMTINMHNMESKTMSQMRDSISDSMERANNSDMNEVMFEVSMDNTVQGLKHGKILQTLYRLIGSKTGKYKVRTLSGKAKRDYYNIPQSERLTKHDIEQGTITVSNLGSIYRGRKGECTILEIIPPQLVAIGVGAAQKKPICTDDGAVGTALILPLTIAFDHRALDMGDIVPFMQKLDAIFRSPEILKSWL
ncbi:MAG: 2-oxo acid dehydrogenase subunit E2 [Ruminococcus sp.]|nr:2-oxo acid dehydrogenase subunit E2 [Ruminococcus sp.]MDY3895357.1 2-oxo acid dehydrogenase subunit E2 [Candidatus Fimenecus sp.]